jgi:hypothetical protein
MRRCSPAKVTTPTPIRKTSTNTKSSTSLFRVPPGARCTYQNSAKQPTIAKIVGDATVAIERDNAGPKGVLKGLRAPRCDFLRVHNHTSNAPWITFTYEKSIIEGVGWAGLEPATNALKGRCSTIELPTRAPGGTFVIQFAPCCKSGGSALEFTKLAWPPVGESESGRNGSHAALGVSLGAMPPDALPFDSRGHDPGGVILELYGWCVGRERRLGGAELTSERRHFHEHATIYHARGA